MMAADLRFAVIGDYGGGTQAEADVARQVQSWNPAFVTTVGDNNYGDATHPAGSAATIDKNIGQFYHNFMFPYGPTSNGGQYGAGSPDGVNHFFPSLGSADWGDSTGDPTGDAPYLHYFQGLPGNGRYYAVAQGNVELFVIDSDGNEPDGTLSTDVQGQWLQGALAASKATWKIVVDHTPPYSSGVVGDSPRLQWPFQAWGATAVLSGQEHDYERLAVPDAAGQPLPYFVDGLGGESAVPITKALDAASVTHFDSDYGAMLVLATDQAITFEFVSRTGQVIDTSTIRAGGTPSAPSAPSNLVATPASPSQVNLSWAEASLGVTSFRVDRSSNGGPFSLLAETASGVTTYQDASASPGVTYTYRIEALVDTTAITSATRSDRHSDYSSVAASTPPLPRTAATSLSTLPLDPASTGLLPIVTLNKSYFGNPLQLGTTVYDQGLGTHAASSLVYNLNGQYSYFLSDIGIDHEQAGNPASVDFQVLADGKLVFDSGLVRTTSPIQHVLVNVSGVQRLTLVVTDAGDGTAHDSADWAGARLLAATPAPVTTATVVGKTGPFPWYSGPVKVTLAAADLAYPASALTTSYSLDGGQTWVVGNSVTFTQQGVSTLLYRSADPAGNVEADNALMVKIDSVAPTTAAQLSGPRNGDGTYKGPVTVALAATDATSGVASTSYTLDGGAPRRYTAAVTASSAGQHVLTFFSTDKAGNPETPQTLRFVIVQASTPGGTNGSGDGGGTVGSGGSTGDQGEGDPGDQGNKKDKKDKKDKNDKNDKNDKKD